MERKLYRSPDKKLCGVCSGIADYFNIDPTIIRIAVALVAVYTTVLPVLLAYLIVALIMPTPPENYFQFIGNTSKRLTKGHDKKISGVCSGFAERFNFDVTIVRVIFVVLFLIFGTGLFAYIVCACIMPQPIDGGFNQNFYGNQNFDQNQYQNPNQGNFYNGQPNQQTPPQGNYYNGQPNPEPNPQNGQNPNENGTQN